MAQKRTSELEMALAAVRGGAATHQVSSQESGSVSPGTGRGARTRAASAGIVSAPTLSLCVTPSPPNPHPLWQRGGFDGSPTPSAIVPPKGIADGAHSSEWLPGCPG